MYEKKIIIAKMSIMHDGQVAMMLSQKSLRCKGNVKIQEIVATLSSFDAHVANLLKMCD